MRAKAKKISGQTDGEDLSDRIIRTLMASEGVREPLGDYGRLSIDRPLSFLCVYRKPPEHDDKGTAHLIMGEASYLLAEGGREFDQNVLPLVRRLTTELADKFGAFMLIEVWAAGTPQNFAGHSTNSKAAFRIFTDKVTDLPSTIEELERRLTALPIRESVEIVSGKGWSPPGMPPLLDAESIRKSGCLVIGIEISPIYRDSETGGLYVSILSDLRRKFSRALQQTFFEFVHVQTPERPTHPQMLGRRKLVDAAWAADAELSALSDTFNYLMAVTPVNASEAFEDFRAARYTSDPVFHYRLLTIDPEDLKRKLYSISFDQIEDPTMAYLLRDKRIELDRHITLIEDRNTPRFLYESLQLFPPVEDELMALAEEILALPRVPAGPCESLDAYQVEQLAKDEIDHYRRQYPEMTATVEIRDDTPPGMMVSHGKLMIGRATHISADRAEALLQHEVGTHIVTYFNGRAQPLKLLYSGLPDYEQLQEGLAVLAEYLVGGLNSGRLRILAARVVAVRRLTQGRSFCEVFDELRSSYRFSERTAFNIAMRAFRGGGLTKDAVYLRGLVEVIRYLREGGDIETLFVGKMGPEHIEIVRELQWREVLRPAPLLPRYMTFPDTAKRLERLKKINSVCDLLAN